MLEIQGDRIFAHIAHLGALLQLSLLPTSPRSCNLSNNPGILRCCSGKMDTYATTAGLPKEKHKFHCLKHSIATHLLDAGADLSFVKDWLGHANIQNTTIYARLTTATLDTIARKIFSSHLVV